MALERLRDKILYSRLKYKDKQAFIKAYDLYLNDIYRFVFFKIGGREEAEDITSQVFLKCWDHIQNKTLTDYKTLKALFYKVARNLVIDQYREKSRQQTVSYDHNPALRNTVEDERNDHKRVETNLDFRALETKLGELKDEYREAIVLRFVNELSIAEMAETLEKSRGNVRVLLYRAVKALREMMDEDKKPQADNNKPR